LEQAGHLGVNDGQSESESENVRFIFDKLQIHTAAHVGSDEKENTMT